MCGLAGAVWSQDKSAIDDMTLRRMADAIRHRGPDGDGYFTGASTDGNLHTALAHRRLSIIDLAGGAQPLGNEDGRVQVVFNGEIYNYRELRETLRAAGHQFGTDSDTEVLVHAYEEYGDAFVTHLRGMFALAIWDARNGRCVLARDRLGQKPLFYRQDGDRLVFASELKSLLQIPDAPRQLNPQALDAYLLYQYVPSPLCILQGYHKLPPGCTLTFDGTSIDLQPYWIPPYADVPARDAIDDAAEWSVILRETLTEAVRLRLRSDVPLGAFLSGGMDSTIIAGLMQQLSDRPVQTFSIGFPIAAFDEREYAREAAKHLGTEHHEFVVTPDAIEQLPRLIWHYDEPFADSSAIPTMYLSQVTRQQVTVALSGDGGDELFAGYDRYRAIALADRVDRLPRLLRNAVTANVWQKLLGDAQLRSRRRRLKRFLNGAALPRRLRYRQWMSVFDDAQRQALYTPEFKSALGSADAGAFLDAALAACPQRDAITQVTCADVLTYLPGDILTKVDIASMAVGLECRSPFLDHHVVELAARLPMDLKLRGRQGKWILQETFADLLPASIRTRRKMGFGVPLDAWFRGELKSLLMDILLAPQTLQRGYFQPDAVRALVQQHLDGEADHSHRLWALLCLELWQRMFLDEAPGVTAPSVLSAVPVGEFM